MKTILILLALLLTAPLRAQLSSERAIVSGGGGLVSGNGFEGSGTIGMPLAGMQTVGDQTTFLGLYANFPAHPPPRGSGAVNAAAVGHSSLSIIPNPTSGAFTALLPSDFGKPERLMLLDVLGKTVRDVTQEVTVDGQNVSCKLPPLPDGAYFFRVESRAQALLYKVLVKK